jgi:hypothetical protein
MRVGERIILKQNNKYDGRAWIGSMWLKLWTSSRFLSIKWRNVDCQFRHFRSGVRIPYNTGDACLRRTLRRGVNDVRTTFGKPGSKPPRVNVHGVTSAQLVTPLLLNRIIVFRSSAATCAIRHSQLAPYGLQPRWTTSYDRSCRSTQCGGWRYFIQHHTSVRHSENFNDIFTNKHTL